MQDLPENFRSDFVQCGDIKVHVVHNGKPFSGEPTPDDRPAILLLHGFPEFWLAWEAVLPHLAEAFHVIVPDQRGYNLTDAPQGVENYRTGLLVGDMVALTQQLLGAKTFSVVGHDWGASVSYVLAMSRPDLVDNLIIANGVHPVCFQDALIDDPAQAKASAYIHLLRSDLAPKHMSENGFVRTFSMFEKFSQTPWLSETLREKYRKAWSDEQRLAAMLNWYSSSPLVVPVEGEPVPDAVLYKAPVEKFAVTMPHLLIWGEKDQALLPSATEHLDQFCSQLVRVTYADADHWLLHTHGTQIAENIRKFVLSG